MNLSSAKRIFFGVAGAFGLMLALLVLFHDRFKLALGVLVAAVGVANLVSGYLKADENDELPPASDAFLQLADPERPLPDGSPETEGVKEDAFVHRAPAE